MYKSVKNEEDYYCLIQCGRGRKFKAEEMYICYVCQKIKCKYCTRTEGQNFQCKAGCNNQYTSGTKTKNAKFCCNNCMECPSCFSPLISKTFKGKYFLSCPTCYWNTVNVHISKSKKEDFDSYIQRVNEETNNGHLRKMYNFILNKLSNDPLIANKPKKKNEYEERINEDSYNDIVKKAMEEEKPNLENFEEKYKLDLSQKEKNAHGKCEYNDDYLNNEENKYYTLNLMNRLLQCSNDYTKNYNSLEEVQKAFNNNELSLNTNNSLKQRHNNVIFQNNSLLDLYPKFFDLIPKKQLFSKTCKECGKIIVEEIDANQKQEGEVIMHNFINQLPIVFINKIDLEENLIKLRFVLLKFININISFKEDPFNTVKVILPAEKFDFEEKEGEETVSSKNFKYKKILVDFKFDDSYKSELVSNSTHLLRFIIKAEFSRNEYENTENSNSVIEYPIEIKFKVK